MCGMRRRLTLAAIAAAALIAAYIAVLVALLGNTGIVAEGPLSPDRPALTEAVPGGLGLQEALERCDPYAVRDPYPGATLKLVGGQIDGRWYYACYEVSNYSGTAYIGYVIEATSGIRVEDDRILRLSGAWPILEDEGFEAEGIRHDATVAPLGMLCISAASIALGLLWRPRRQGRFGARALAASARPVAAPTLPQLARRGFDWIHSRRGLGTILACAMALSGLRIIVDFGSWFGPKLTWADLASRHPESLLTHTSLTEYPNDLLLLALLGFSAAWLEGLAAALLLRGRVGALPTPSGPIATEIAAAIASVRADLEGQWDSQVVTLASSICTELAGMLDRLEDLPGTSPDLFILRRIPTSYLPDTLTPYFNLPREYATGHQLQDGTTPRERVLAQLEILHSRLDQVRDAIAAQDLQSLVANGRFLETRFAASPLTVPGDRGDAGMASARRRDRRR
jgi:hypothetical protein